MNAKSFVNIALAAVLTMSAAGAEAISFNFQAFGGFTDPAASDCAPNCNVNFNPPVEYDVLNPADTLLEAYHHFGWGRPFRQPEHSHLTSNEINPLSDSLDLSGYHQIVEPGIVVEKNPIGPGGTTETIDAITVGDRVGEIIGWLDHHNNVLFPPEFEGQVSFHYHFLIEDPGDPSTFLFDSGEQLFVIDVFETLNFGPCPTANLAGSVCDDRFRFANGNAVPPVAIVDDVFDKTITNALTGEDFFAYQGKDYRVNINAFWQDGDILGAFYSPEQGPNFPSGVSRMFIRGQIMPGQIIPEPATVILIGVGLAGLGFARRQRSRCG